MKKQLLLLLAVILLPMVASADAVEKDGLFYNLNHDTKEASIISASENCKGDIVIPSDVEINGQTFNVISIEDKAFKGCHELTSVTISNGLYSIGNNAFEGCDGLSSLFIPNSVTSIGVAAFAGCNGLTSIGVSDGNMVYDSRNNCNAIIETETNLLLIGCNVSTIPYGVQSIGARAFGGCLDLKTISIPSTVTIIGGAAFANSGLVSIDIPNSVNYIMSEAFTGCKSLTSIKLPNSISSIEQGIFRNCSSLNSVEIPNGVKYIGSYAFQHCSKLESIELPNSVTNIGEWAFENCDALKTIKIPKGVVELRNNVFYYCDNLQFVYLPSSLKTIGNTFDGCWVLSDVYCFAEDVPSANSRSFYFPAVDNYTTLHVPASSIDKYKSASIWDKFGNIVALTDEELKMYDDDNPGGTVNPEPDGVIEGVYLIQPESYRIYNGNKQTYDRAFDILITDNGDGSYHVNDLLGGWYQRYGINYAMTGNIVIAADGTVSLKDSYIAGWGDSLVGLTGSYDASTSSFTIEAEYVEGMKFFQNWVKDYKVFTVDGINYRIGENFTVSVIKGYYSGDIVIPEMVSYNGITYSVTSFDEKAFRWCTDITSIIIPNSVTSLGQKTFERCKNLSFVSIPNSVTYIDESVFSGCSSLNSINIPNSVVSIGYGAFSECYSLSNLTLSENLTTIGQNSFTACNGLKSLIIPASVLKIGIHAFSECEGLESVKVENENTKYDSRNDCNAIIETYSNRLILGCKNTIIPQDVTTIGDAAFGCIKDLDYFLIPNSVTSIESGAFWNCTGMKDFYCYSETVPSTHQTAFNEAPIQNATLHVPAASVEVYKQTNPWSGFGKIVALTEDDPKPTGIMTIETSSNDNYIIYNLNGVRQSEPRNGINIINGKKYVKK